MLNPAQEVIIGRVTPQVLVVMAGLPVSGKSAVAHALAQRLDLCLFELDHLEAPFLGEGISGDAIGWAGYAALTALADDNLGLGHSVVLDCVTWNGTQRSQWAGLAAEHSAAYRPIEVVCSDDGVHRQRIRERRRGIPGLPEVPWLRIEEARRLYEPWGTPRLLLDSVRPLSDLVDEAEAYIRGSPFERMRPRTRGCNRSVAG